MLREAKESLQHLAHLFPQIASCAKRVGAEEAARHILTATTEVAKLAETSEHSRLQQ
jgi:hypothetical protein